MNTCLPNEPPKYLLEARGFLEAKEKWEQAKKLAGVNILQTEEGQLISLYLTGYYYFDKDNKSKRAKRMIKVIENWDAFKHENFVVLLGSGLDRALAFEESSFFIEWVEKKLKDIDQKHN